MHDATKAPAQLHATCVAWKGQGVLITGKSGSGKSALALKLMALGAVLVADDQTILRLNEGHVIATCPKPIQDMIEARGVGLLKVTTCPRAVVVCVIDMDVEETDRLPPHRVITLLGTEFPLLHKVAHDHFPSAILHYVKGGRIA